MSPPFTARSPAVVMLPFAAMTAAFAVPTVSEPPISTLVPSNKKLVLLVMLLVLVKNATCPLALVPFCVTLEPAPTQLLAVNVQISSTAPFSTALSLLVVEL